MISTPFYPMVPKDFTGNMTFRKQLIRDGSESQKKARDIWIMCARDPLFYINSFTWVYEPRKKIALPFITWKFQDDALLQVLECIGKEDILIEKSRDMGASYICLTAFEWEWHFHEFNSFMIVSRKEDLVDKAEDPDALMWKLDFYHKHQPGWMRPQILRNKLLMQNVDNGSVIAGDSTTGDVARGGRRTAILLDEFASVEDGERVLSATADTTTCRIYNSTPKGTANAFYTVKQSGVRKLRLHWPLHPEKGAGLYYDADGKPHSPWYDKEVKRRSHPMEIAQELDIDYLGSDYQFFDSVVLDRISKDLVRKPFARGDIDYDVMTLEPRRFIERPDGPLLLWLYVDAKGQAPTDREFVLGVDIATGTGSSNSVISGCDAKVGEKVLEYANPRINPDSLAKYAVVLARWLKGSSTGARMIWEANGPGRIFGTKVVELGYRRIYYRQRENSLSKKISDVPGWFSTKETKLDLLGRYRSALDSGEFINRSKMSIDECRNYVYLPNGIVAHSASAATLDPSGASDNHGDRVIADALAHRGTKEAGSKAVEEPETPRDCFQGRRDEHNKLKKVEMW